MFPTKDGCWTRVVWAPRISAATLPFSTLVPLKLALGIFVFANTQSPEMSPGSEIWFFSSSFEDLHFGQVALRFSVIQQDFLWSRTLADTFCIRSNQSLGNTTVLGIGCVYIREALYAVMAASFVVILCNPIYFDAHKADPYTTTNLSQKIQSWLKQPPICSGPGFWTRLHKHVTWGCWGAL